jgi:hypothetical protein
MFLRGLALNSNITLIIKKLIDTIGYQEMPTVRVKLAFFGGYESNLKVVIVHGFDYL